MAEQQFRHYRDLYLPFLRLLRDMGGAGQAEEVCQRFLARHRDQFAPSFFTDIVDKDVKWHDWVHRVHFLLKDGGYVTDPRRGYWALTDKPWPANKEDF